MTSSGFLLLCNVAHYFHWNLEPSSYLEKEMLQTLTISIYAGVIEPDTKPHIPEDGTSPAQVKTEDDCKAECVDSAGEDDDLDDETDKSFDPIEDRRRSRSICYGITKLDLESSIIRAVNGST